jgi:hypothetical protein
MAPWTIAAVALLLNSAYLASTATASPLTVGLGGLGSVAAIEIAWPSGRAEKLAGGAPGQTRVIEEARGIVGHVPFAAQSLRSPTGPR